MVPATTFCSATLVYSTASNFGDDVIVDAGIGGVVDTIQFSGPGLTDIAELDNRSTVGDDGGGLDVLATVFTDSTKTTMVGSILIVDLGGIGVVSWATINSLSSSVQVVVV